MTDLDIAVAALVAKQPFYARLWDYYEGTPPLAYSTERLRAVFHDLDAKFSENWCLPVGAPVLTDRGIVPVHAVRVGDKVPGHDGEMHCVERIYERQVDEQLVTLRTYGSPVVDLTSNHPVLVSQRKKLSPITTKYADAEHFSVYGTGPNTSYRLDSIERVWLPAGEVEKGDIVWGPIIAPAEECNCSPEMLRLLGWYVSEGSVSDTGRIAFSLHVEETDFANEIERLLQSVWGLKSSRLMGRGRDMQVVAYSKERAAELAWLGGRGCAGKRLAPEVMAGDTRELMLNAWRGDGDTPSERRAQMAYGTVSFELAVQMQQMMLREGLCPAWRTIPAKPGHRRAYQLSVSGESARRLAALLNGTLRDTVWDKAPSAMIADGQVGYAVAAVGRRHYAGTVYDLQVADVHSFVLPGSVTVHNCAVVVDSVIDRVNLAGFSITGNDDAAKLLNQLFLSTELSLDSDDAHLAALVCGDAFIIAWGGDNGPEAFYNDPRACHIQYDVENPRKKLWAAKWWLTDDGRCRLTMYYPDRLEKYATANSVQGAVDQHTKFKPEGEPEKNPYGVIPVFHLRRDRRTIKSEISDVLPLQDAVNKLLSDAMIAAEFGAFRQRYVISTAGVDGLKNAPNEIWDIPAGDGGGQATSVGEFAQTDLGVYFAAIDHLATAMSVITRTPKHYVYGQGGDPSGEALIAMEAPLIRKCTRYIERFTTTWQRIGSFLLHVAGVEIAPEQITPLFDRPETVQPRTTAEIRELGVRAGVPLVTMLRDEGKDEAWLAAMEQDRAAQDAAKSATLAAAMLEAQRRFDSGGVEGE